MKLREVYWNEFRMKQMSHIIEISHAFPDKRRVTAGFKVQIMQIKAAFLGD